MPDIQWTSPGATLSHKNAAKEFGLAEQEIIRAIKEGTLHYQIAHAHGNPYYRVVRAEVEAPVLALYGPEYVSRQQLKKRQDDIVRETPKLKRRLEALEKERLSLSGLVNNLIIHIFKAKKKEVEVDSYSAKDFNYKLSSWMFTLKPYLPKLCM